MLKSVAAGVIIGVAAKVGQNEEGGIAGVFGFALDGGPQVGAKTVSTANAFDVERIGSGVGNVNVVQGDPEEARRLLAHQLTRHVDGEFVGAGKRARVRFEVIHREFEHPLQLIQCKLVTAERGCVEGRFVTVAEQMFVIAGAASHRRGEQMLGENHAGAKAGPVRAVAALSNAIKSIAGGYDPGIRGRALQILAKVFKRRGMFRGQGSKVIQGFVDACGQTGRGHIMAENSAIDDLRKESGLRDQLADQMWNILLTFRRKSLLIPGAASKSDDHHFSLFERQVQVSKGMGRKQSASEGEPGSAAKKVTAGGGEPPNEFLRTRRAT